MILQEILYFLSHAFCGIKMALRLWQDYPLPLKSIVPCQLAPLHIVTPLSPLNRLRVEAVPLGGSFDDLPLELRSNCHKAGAARIGHRAVYGRLHPDKPAGTITAMFDSFTRGRAPKLDYLCGHAARPKL